MLPREVWDENCMPQSMPHETKPHVTMLSTEFNYHMALINHLVRKDNWGMDSSYEEDYHDPTKGEETWFIYFSVDPKQIRVDLAWWQYYPEVDIHIIYGNWEKELEIMILYRSVCWRGEVAVLLQDGDSDSEGLNGRYELTDSDSEVAGDTGGTSY